MKKNNGPERWHGAHHYSDKLHFFFVFFLFLGIITIVGSYFVLGTTNFSAKVHPTITPTPKTSCTPRPSCLDSTPRCMIPETSDMCPPSITPTSNPDQDGKVFCTQEAKLCADGKTYVGRTGPNCEFTACPSH